MNAHAPPTEQEHFDTARKYQEYYDDALREVGIRIPAPVLGKATNHYRRETLHSLSQAALQNHELSKVDYRALKSDALAVIEAQVLAAVRTERVNPRNVPLGQIKPIKVLDQYGRTQMTKFIGQESFVKQLNRAGRRVLSFTAGDRVYDATKGSCR